jgi:hypothetical protein
MLTRAVPAAGKRLRAIGSQAIRQRTNGVDWNVERAAATMVCRSRTHLRWPISCS